MVEDRLKLPEGEIAVLDEGPYFACVCDAVEGRVWIGGLDAQIPQGIVEFEDAVGDVCESWRGLPSADVEGPRKGVDDVDVLYDRVAPAHEHGSIYSL